ncbi:phage integrase SAM-like domain-containing protein [Capnocytophaga cynodegmi]|uniref:Uncharacterized protein n=1 Tax=Capnocytophaga cynodegmi TaxID=28189 RepID=A0A0B7HNB9_9FLAO|nr:phage integrase SAM-like domain-containing protein [Capnocytophaga cynodegmi]CEN36990.1 conserved hypothetical protein [Capnocytophaga cynodegmi]CEN39003.1 conserved hypothetical protein [Capnocytophaga cynodegmi]
MIKYHSQFLLDKEKDKPDARLRYRIKWSGNIVAFNLGFRIEIEKWSIETQRCKANTTHGKKKTPASIINRNIQKFEQACEETFKFFEVQKQIPTREEFQYSFNKQIDRVEKIVLEKSFFEYYNDFIKEEASVNQWTIGTKQKLNTVKNHLQNFDSELSFESFTEEKFVEYVSYLQKELKFKNTTVMKNISFVKWFLKWSVRKNYNKHTFFENFRPKFKNTQKKVIFLRPPSLSSLENTTYLQLKSILNG